MIKSILIVGVGSFVGGALRYIISVVMKNVCGSGFPWRTLVVNLLGCFLFGLIFALFSKYNSLYNPLCLLLTTGICGGFTTFSTFANESMQMLRGGNTIGFIIYVASSVLIGILLIAFGYYIVK